MTPEPTSLEEDRTHIHQAAIKTGTFAHSESESSARNDKISNGKLPTADRHAWQALGILFASTILVSAFLLFQVQPLISKYILPWFGGSPAVWTTCMLFFQLVLFAGYLYAHLLTRFFSPRNQGIIHLVLMGAAIAMIFPTVAPSVDWKPLDSSLPTTRILALLGMTVGLPYFVLSTTGPLVQAWFARTWPTRSPYRLYALSNVGSLAALVTYPFLFEPAFASDVQAGLWTWAFGLFAVLCGLCAVWVFRLPHEEPAPNTATDNSSGKQKLVEHVSFGRRALWIALPAWASLMLLATTNFVCQDVAVIPFLWVVPLSLYLLTFIICFDHPRWYLPLPMAIAAMVLVVLSAGAAYWMFGVVDAKMTYLHDLALYFSTMFVVCMLCHGQLVRLRPSTKHLTEYYLLISLGGAVGGIFVSLIAPQIFKTHFEWPIALAGALGLGAIACIKRSVHWSRAYEDPLNPKTVAVGALTAVCVVAGAFWLIRSSRPNQDTIYEGRNFYGTVSVLERYEGTKDHNRTFFSGGVGHGKQYVDPAKRHIPIAYFSEKTGIGRTLKYFQPLPDTRVGVVGMGVGVVAVYAKPGHSYRLYEINEQVDYIARNYFTFLNDCQGKCEVVLADARLALERELAEGKRHRFHVLALDAFNGDAPPVHLLTEEAFKLYLDHLEPDGVIVVNITNRYINLVPVVNAVAKKYGMQTTRVMTPYEPDELLNRTDFMMLSKNADFIASIPPVIMPELLQPEYEVPLWTDQYSNLFSILKR